MSGTPPTDLLPATYARSVEAAGAVAVLLPPQIARGAERGRRGWTG